MADVEDPHDVVTGVAEVDREHLEQIALVEALESAAREGAPAQEQRERLARLTEFTNAHFLSEQLLMRRHAYPMYEDHVQDHDQAIAVLRDLQAGLDRGEGALPVETLESLRRWLLAHMRSRDRAFGTYLAAHPVASSG